MKKKKMLVAIVVWRDHTGTAEWVLESEMEENSQLHEIVSVGWLKRETDEKIVLVGTVDQSRDAYSHIQTISKSMIVSMRVGGKSYEIGDKAKQQSKKSRSAQTD